ncbi:MAG: extracellular solute-binding protein [Marinobacterium sp.]|nr:extracellular solute-binding protein [Marinobacterium sp.]
MSILKKAVMGSTLMLVPAFASAACMVKGTGEVNVISNSFPSAEVAANAAKACEGNGLTIKWKLTRESETEIPQALSASVTPYELTMVTNESATQLQAAGKLQAMNDLVEKYREQYQIDDSMLIRFGNDIMAIAFQVNAQNLFFRKDLLEKYGLETPETYEDVLAAAKVLKQEESIEFPLAGTYKSGWNLAQEFVNLYLAAGGEFFKPGSVEPTFNNETGVKTLQLLKELSGYMSPNFLALDTTAVMQQFQQGKIAMANLWASRAAKMDDAKESKVVGMIDFAAAPATYQGGKPATTLWWDGFAMPKSMDGDRDLAFQVMMESISRDVVENNQGVTTWLRSNYKPTRYAAGVAASARGGAAAYPMIPQMTLAHSALGNNIGDFLIGKESAAEALADAETAYRTAAKEAGYLK